MARFTVTRRGVSGPGEGGQYSYSVRAASEGEAVAKAAVKADRLLHRLNRGGTELDPTPTAITRTR